MPDRPAVLLASATDSTGGAGVYADWRACAATRVHSRIAITAVTAQQKGSPAHVAPVRRATFAAQLEAAGAVRAVKVGLIPSADLVTTLGRWLDAHPIPVVVDPVLRSSSGAELTTSDAFAAVQEDLIPRCTLLTPNLPECEALLGRPVRSLEAAREAAQELATSGTAVLLKGGHGVGPTSTDVLVTSSGIREFVNDRRQGRPVRGTGCWLATAIACRLALGVALGSAVAGAIEDQQAAWSDARPAPDGTAVL